MIATACSAISADHGIGPLIAVRSGRPRSAVDEFRSRGRIRPASDHDHRRQRTRSGRDVGTSRNRQTPALRRGLLEYLDDGSEHGEPDGILGDQWADATR